MYAINEINKTERSVCQLVADILHINVWMVLNMEFIHDLQARNQ